ncbi:MAG: HEPN domain-containing protein, partial [Thermoproteota archaeon]
FSLEQSLQLFLKARLLENGVDYPRTHSVRTLMEVLSRVVKEELKAVLKEMLDKYLLELGILEDAYISSRYVTREFRKEEVEKLRKAVEETMKNVS